LYGLAFNAKRTNKNCIVRESNPGRIEVVTGNDPGYHYPNNAVCLIFDFFMYQALNDHPLIAFTWYPYYRKARSFMLSFLITNQLGSIGLYIIMIMGDAISLADPRTEPSPQYAPSIPTRWLH
jgi:hypothetical protein